MVSADGVQHGLAALAVLLEEVHADDRMAALHLMVHRLADVVQETRTARDRAIEPELVGDQLAEVRDLDRVAQHILAIAGAEPEAPHRLDDLRMKALHVGLDDSLGAEGVDAVLHLPARVLHGLLDARWVHAAIGDELLQSLDGDGLAHAVEAAHGDDAGRVVDDDVDASGLLDGADVASLAADQPALHVVAGDLHRAHDGVCGGLARIALDRLQRDLARPVGGARLGLGNELLLEGRGLKLAALAGVLQHQRARLLGREAGDLREPVAQRGAVALKRCDPILDLLRARRERLLLRVEPGLALGDALELALERVLDALRALLALLHARKRGGHLAVDRCAALARGSLCGEFGLLGAGGGALDHAPCLVVGAGGGGPLGLRASPAAPHESCRRRRNRSAHQRKCHGRAIDLGEDVGRGWHRVVAGPSYAGTRDEMTIVSNTAPVHNRAILRCGAILEQPAGSGSPQRGIDSRSCKGRSRQSFGCCPSTPSA